jgi:uncharacterized protein YjbJ (UPF0337 family)
MPEAVALSTHQASQKAEFDFSVHGIFPVKDCQTGILAKALPMETEMNWDIVEGNWKQFKGKMREEWGKLNDNHLDKIGGVRDRVAGEKQETVGTDRVEADRLFKADEQAGKDNRL